MRSLCRCLNMQSSASENRRPRKRFLYDVRGRASSSDHRFYLPSTNSEMSRMAANAPSYSSTIDEDVDVAHRRLTGLAAALPFALACYGRNQQLFLHPSRWDTFMSERCIGCSLGYRNQSRRRSVLRSLTTGAIKTTIFYDVNFTGVQNSAPDFSSFKVRPS